MQRITVDSGISYVITEKELKEIRADEKSKTEAIKEFADKIKLHMIQYCYCHSRLEQQYCAVEIIDYIGKLMGEKDYSIDVEAEMKKHDEAIRVKERKKVLNEVIKIARAEIDFENQAEQKRFVEFMEEMKKGE